MSGDGLTQMPNLIGGIAIFINLLAIFAGFFYVQWQIRTMLAIENQKRVIAIQALIFELENNKDILIEYIDHWWKGGHSHLILINGSGPTYDLQIPHFVNYEQFLPLACYDNEGLAKIITEIYLNCDACRAIIQQVLNFISNNQLYKNNSSQALNDYEKEIVKHNRQICEISKETVILFNKAIHELTLLKESVLGKKNWRTKMDNKKIKRIIAREGLILLGIIIFLIIIFISVSVYNDGHNYETGIYKRPIYDFINKNSEILTYLCIFGYLIYITTKFVSWAIRTIKEK